MKMNCSVCEDVVEVDDLYVIHSPEADGMVDFGPHKYVCRACAFIVGGLVALLGLVAIAVEPLVK